MRKLLLFFIILIPLISAQEEDIFHTDMLEIHTRFSNQLELIPREPNPRTEYVKAFNYFTPQDSSRQQILELNTFPPAEFKDDYWLYEWENPPNVLDYWLDAKIRTSTRYTEITQKVTFPIKNLEQEYQIYTKPTALIDINAEIIELASDLAEGETDLYKVVFNLADWAKSNIKYDLNTVTADASQKASWVLENREGVCDEITTLFIALARSLGIPARFISGISYTNSDLFDEEWGLHGWAEVYFPGFGWVPFDVTYGELGYLDAGHIDFQHSHDANKSTSKYEWRSTGADLKINPLDMTTNILKKGKVLDEFFDSELIIYDGQVGFGSYNLAELTLKNKARHYVTTEVALSSTKEIEYDKERRAVLLGPLQEKKLFWIIKVSDELSNRFIYTFPVTVMTAWNNEIKAEFKSEEKDAVHTKLDIESVLLQKEQKEIKSYSRELTLECDANRTANTFEKIPITCQLKNTGNVLLRLDVCMNNDCSPYSIGIGQEEKITFFTAYNTTGDKAITVTASNKDVSAAWFLNILIKDMPRLSIEELEYPESVDFSQNFNIDFIIKKVSIAFPLNVKLTLDINSDIQEWTINKLVDDQPVKVSARGDMLDFKNNIMIKASFQDEEGNAYEVSETLDIRLNDLTFFEKIMVYVNRLQRKLLKLL